ncbi:DEAD/DEAH box helicase [Corynebacterium sp. sy017]|uniref:DEAD/DEAH box helicase n=1 Tax=unclassified Corynebacterium TaxID=2624378 RepID=UPI001185FC9F|nr:MULTISPECIES: DEAD/DEAH box helicase [unclassified Corynebacterium]MBP3089378.1 DEAD/DEAH box helicase [Corynebacterium sp. sy017]TSD90930.1 DEAD/DEAH box helicase [Corynebacterium sp. SY003]
MHENNPVLGDQLGMELTRAITEALPHSSYTHIAHLAPRPARHSQWASWIQPALISWLYDAGISKPYQHQMDCADAAFAGKHVVIATGTSSGKSLGYQLPILSTLATDPTACAIYLTPTKALGADQLGAITAMTSAIEELSDVHPAPYDGDTPTDARAAIREHSRFIFSNPDMLHHAILPNHARWARLLRHVKYIVVDECHSYRGVFGAHVSLVLRRLLRICARYGAQPTVIAASATSNDPAAHASNLIGAQVHAVTEDCAPTGARTIMLWEPGLVNAAENTAEIAAADDTDADSRVQTKAVAPIRYSASHETAEIMAVLVAEGARTLSFVRSRRQAEIVALRCSSILSQRDRPDLAERIAAYRAGYLAEERRKLERHLDDGTLLGVASTNALELGIDVGGLDSVVMAGYPGTAASFWQQAGRAGRRGQSSLIVLVARDEPMDMFLIHHPQALLERPIERNIFDPTNPHILVHHVLCAALEAPLSDAELAALQAEQVAADLAEQGLLRRRAAGWFTTLPPHSPDPHAQVSLRGNESDFVIVDSSDGRILGSISSAQVFAQAHPGAVYLHQGESFLVEDLDIAGKIALVKPETPDYITHSRSTTNIRVLSSPDQQHISNPAPGIWISNIDVEVTTQVIGYFRSYFDGSSLGLIPLELPQSQLRTRAVAYTVDPTLLSACGIADVPGALHAAEHAAIGMLPLIATCDRWDIGGVSTELHSDTGLPTVFVYDAHPGGAGFADCGFEHFGDWIAATYAVIDSCSCEKGCPSCIQSPKCGNGNNPLSKADALLLLKALLNATQA